MKRPGFFILMLLLVVCWRNNASGQTLTSLWQFGSLSNDADGGSPSAGLIQASDGNFYGTSGWTNEVNCTVFKITPDGTLTTLWHFGSLSNNADGTSLMSGLVQGRDGDFYGTTARGGTNRFCGTAYKITSGGTLTPLWQFGSLSNAADGVGPNGLVQCNDGNFYGTTAGLGELNSSGTVFRLTPQGTLTTLYSFGNVAGDGVYPYASLVQGSDGNFYGTTLSGGSNNDGTIFMVTSSGTLTTLWQFTGGVDGGRPQSALVQGRDGSFYGTTPNISTRGGSIFKITSAGTLTTLWQFTGGADGFGSYGALVQGSDGNFYGTTTVGQIGFTVFGGTVFQITPAGTLTTLWQFPYANFTNGVSPHAGLVQGSDGAFYGTTTFGGTNSVGQYGTVFKLCVPLNPPANQISSLNPANSDIIVSVPSVAGETYQLQYTTDLTSGNWSNIPGACVSNSLGALLTATNFGCALAPQGFYRFDITP